LQIDTKLVNAAVKIKLSLIKRNEKQYQLESDLARLTKSMTYEEFNEYKKRIVR